MAWQAFGKRALGLVLVVAVAVAAAFSPRDDARAADGWFSGTIVNSISYTCPGPIIPSQQILGIGAYTSYWTDLDGGVPSGNRPRVGDVFYARINVTAVGAACQGFGIVPTVRLPAGVSIAVDATNKLRCFFTSDFGDLGFSELSAAECPQQMVQTFDGNGQTVYSVRAPSNSVYYPAWPLACAPLSGKCGAFEFWVPLVSSQEYVSTPLVTPVHAIDGWTDPWVYPQVALRVGAANRTLGYPNPSTTAIGDTGAVSHGNLSTLPGEAGTVFFDLGTTASYGLTISGAVPAGACYPGCNDITATWTGLTPGTLYHWRMRFVPSGGGGAPPPDDPVTSTIVGIDQTFTTTGTAPTDTTPPSVTLTAPAYTRTTTIPITVTATDDRGISGYGLSESAETEPLIGQNFPPQTHTFEGADGGADGSRTVCAWAYDTKLPFPHNKNKACKTVVLDRAKPTAALSLPAFAKSSTVAVTATGGDPGGSGVNGYVLTTTNAAPDPVSGPWLDPAPATFTFPAGGGSKTLYLFTRDRAGNVSLAASATTFIDSTKPTATLKLPAFSRSRTVKVTASGADTGGSGFNGYRLGTSSTPPAATGAGWVATAPKTFTFPAGDGKKTLYLFTRDRAGNVSAAATASVFIDTKAPLPKITGPTRNQVLKKLVTVKGTVQDGAPSSGLKSGQFAIRKKAGTTCTWWHPVQKKFLAGTCATQKWFGLPLKAAWSKPAGGLAQAGGYTLFVRFTDRAGNAKTLSVPFRIRP